MLKVIDYTKEHTFLLLMIIKQGGMQSLSALAPEKGRGPRSGKDRQGLLPHQDIIHYINSSGGRGGYDLK